MNPIACHWRIDHETVEHGILVGWDHDQYNYYGVAIWHDQLIWVGRKELRITRPTGDWPLGYYDPKDFHDE